jgi:hypothetical protein
VKAEHNGFTPTEVRDVVLNVNDQVAIKIHLNIGTVSQTVLVVDGASLINESPAVATVVDRQFVANLPLNGRSFQSLISLTPGVVVTKTASTEQGQFSVNGQRADANYFTVDGVSANIGVTAQAGLSQGDSGALPGLAAFGGTNNLVSVDALQEFKVQTSTYAPEFGRTPGAQVQILTRSGTNDFRGTLFEYFRNDALDSNDYFANRAGLSKPPLRQNDFGGVFSGPILFPRFGEGGRQPWYNGRNRTFFFFSYEGLRLRLPQTGLTTVPSLNARQIAPVSTQPFLNAFPRPNGRDLANNFSEFNATFSNPSTLNATSIRIDHIVNSKLTLFARYNHAPSDTTLRGGGNSLNTLTVTSFKTQTLTGGVTMVTTPAISNELRVNYSRNEGISSNLIDTFGGASVPSDSVLFPSFESSKDRLFIISVTGGRSTVFAIGKQANNVQRQINLADNVSIVTGSHQLKFGIDYRRLSPIFDPYLYQQTDVFDGVNGMVAGRASLASIQANAGKRFPVFTNLSLYAQDNWKITPRLILTYGGRWEVNPAPSDANGNEPFAVTNLDNPTTLAFAPQGTPLYKTTYNNFAPRLGIAYHLSQRRGSEMVLRGGFGIFYDLGYGQIANAFANAFPNTTIKPALLNVAFPLDQTSAAPRPFSLLPPFGTVVVADPNLKLPRTYQWNFTVEQSLGSAQTVTASYVAAVGRRLLRQETLRNPNANFTTVNVTRNTATSDYHAMQLQFQRRLLRGLQALVSYTWSHSIDSISGDSFPTISAAVFDPKLDRGSSDFDVRHAFSSAVTYNIPKPKLGAVGEGLLRDWSIDSIVTARTATPVNVLSGRSFLGTTRLQRPDLVLGVPLYINDPAVAGGRRINSSAFTIPPATLQGTLGRNALRGFGMWQVDFAVRRQFKLTERVNLQFKSEFFNVFNHPNFADPGAGEFTGTKALSSPLFGQSIIMLGRGFGTGGIVGGFNPLYQVGGPRSLQLALRLEF